MTRTYLKKCVKKRMSSSFFNLSLIINVTTGNYFKLDH